MKKEAALSQSMPHLDGRQQVMCRRAMMAAEQGQYFFYVLIHEPLKPEARGEKYEDPIADALGDLGDIVGGGSQLADDDSIAFCGIDVVVNDRDRGLEILRGVLRKCGARSDTVIEEYVPAFAVLSL